MSGQASNLSIHELHTSRSESRRHRSQRHGADRRRHGRRRLVFFSIASFSGFLIGTLALLGGLTFLGRPLHPDPLLGALVLLAGLASIAGGGLTALAYREVTKG